MRIRTILRALRFIGLPNIVRAQQYTGQRRRLEERHPPAPPGSPEGVGRLRLATPIPGGALFQAEQRQLEAVFLADDLLRLTWQPGKLPLKCALQDVDWPVVEVRLHQQEAGWALVSKQLQLQVAQDGSLVIQGASGVVLRQELPPHFAGPHSIQRSVLRAEEKILGLGGRAAPLNLRPGSYRMWNRDPGGEYSPGDDPLYLTVPTYLGVHREGSYLVFYENTHAGQMDFGQQAQVRFEDGALRYYFIPGPPDHALERYTQLTGRAPLPPRWALGFHQSRWGYQDEETIRQVAAGFAAHQLPISAIHLDLDYMEDKRVFTVSDQRFPTLSDLADELLSDNVQLVAIIDPGVQAQNHFPTYRDGKTSQVFCMLEGKEMLAPVWPGWCAFPDFTDPEVRRWWGRLYPSLLEVGIGGFWHDMNEPAVFIASGEPTLPGACEHHMEGRGGDHREAHNVYGLLMNQAGFEALRRLRPEQRPFLLSRSGWAGSQRYAWNWTGDNASNWESLAQSIPSVLGLGVSGFAYSGPDIGGFSGAPDAELFVRWFQLGAFMPFFRTHSAIGTPRREPWCFGEKPLSIIGDSLRLRYRLLPYLYTLAWQASLAGQPLIRPLGWADPGAMSLWEIEDQFLLGEDLLVAPVLEPGAATRSLSLPSGGWYHFWDDVLHQGPGEIVLPSPLERIPLLVRAGSLIPMAAGRTLALHLYVPEGGQHLSHVYHDAGDGYGDWRLDRFRLERQGSQIDLAWEQEGGFPFPYDEIQLHLHGAAGKKFSIDLEEQPQPPGIINLEKPFRRLRIEL